ncbi:hypothetical protein WR25_25741 [Diploscapter pachys]|uniref:Uncharacterized protein n=1 Tax=Diploscapter pachys TaxID=2018661 RepID=A0A2A2JE47_9BILA|nr:hypothetical protein WR25_25741 [Diploscapter pachys]
MLIADFSSTYIVYIIVLALGYFAVLILPSITLTLATMALCKRRQLIQINLTTVCVSLGSVIVSGIGVAFAAYACTKTLVEYDEKWQKTALSLYGYGLKESLLSLYFMLASVFMFFAFTQRLLGVQLSAFLIQILCIILLIVYLLTPARFTSIISNAQLLVIYPQTGPISQLNLVVLYSSYVLLLAILCLQLFLSAQSLSVSFHLLTQPPHGSFCSPPFVISNNELSTSSIAPVVANCSYSNSSRSDTIHYAEPRVVISNERTSF